MSRLAFEVRGIRNHNPGNIDYHTTNPWNGLDVAKPSDGRFCRFISPEYGIRAMARVLRNYTKRDGLPGVGGPGIDTVREVINRWAPPSENVTSAYVASVAKAVGVEPDIPINIADRGVMTLLIEAIIRHENGLQPYSVELILRGIDMA
ncbi:MULTISPECIES: hypothetical protein [Aeromonas]|uniref:hypothetical protein n=1 Tax=Aeromonas TaxID=642 RepID=UPI000955EF78|nr:MULTISPECIES: hypothetical protein [Aeromonas]MDX7852976.1 hypothetical protein [Aeromonas caviae]SIP88325.1 hypothetical protein SAMN05878295_10180 [Aeromonas hydrophila]SIR30578.1 hypothetical protein SAMN05880569_11221 [Aeromonas hydrophila]